MPSGFSKEELLSAPVRHIDMKQLNIVPLVAQMSDTAFQARNLVRPFQTALPDSGWCITGGTTLKLMFRSTQSRIFEN